MLQSCRRILAVGTSGIIYSSAGCFQPALPQTRPSIPGTEVRRDEPPSLLDSRMNTVSSVPCSNIGATDTRTVQEGQSWMTTGFHFLGHPLLPRSSSRSSSRLWTLATSNLRCQVRLFDQASTVTSHLPLHMGFGRTGFVSGTGTGNCHGSWSVRFHIPTRGGPYIWTRPPSS